MNRIILRPMAFPVILSVRFYVFSCTILRHALSHAVENLRMKVNVTGAVLITLNTLALISTVYYHPMGSIIDLQSR